MRSKTFITMSILFKVSIEPSIF